MTDAQQPHLYLIEIAFDDPGERNRIYYWRERSTIIMASGSLVSARSSPKGERERIADRLVVEADLCPCDEDGRVLREAAGLVRADFSHDAAEDKRLREIVNPDNEGQVDEIGLEWSKRYHAALRDAERYRWLRAEHRLSEVFVCDGADALNLDNCDPEDIDALIDAEVAREKADG